MSQEHYTYLYHQYPTLRGFINSCMLSGNLEPLYDILFGLILKDEESNV